MVTIIKPLIQNLEKYSKITLFSFYFFFTKISQIDACRFKTEIVGCITRFPIDHFRFSDFFLQQVANTFFNFLVGVEKHLRFHYQEHNLFDFL
jgi:hypothetical protein